MLIFEKLYTWQKMLRAPWGIKKSGKPYMVMPPGWSHTGNHKTARVYSECGIGKQEYEYIGV